MQGAMVEDTPCDYQDDLLEDDFATEVVGDVDTNAAASVNMK